MTELENFMEYLGKPESLATYSRSYKLVFYKILFSEMDEKGRIPIEKMIQGFRAFFQNRLDAGLLPEINAPVYERVDTSTDDEIESNIMLNPYRVISQKHFVNRRVEDGVEFFCLKKELVQALNTKSVARILAITENKLELYFEKRCSSNNKL